MVDSVLIESATVGALSALATSFLIGRYSHVFRKREIMAEKYYTRKIEFYEKIADIEIKLLTCISIMSHRLNINSENDDEIQTLAKQYLTLINETAHFHGLISIYSSIEISNVSGDVGDSQRKVIEIIGKITGDFRGKEVPEEVKLELLSNLSKYQSNVFKLFNLLRVDLNIDNIDFNESIIPLWKHSRKALV